MKVTSVTFLNTTFLMSWKPSSRNEFHQDKAPKPASNQTRAANTVFDDEPEQLQRRLIPGLVGDRNVQVVDESDNPFVFRRAQMVQSFLGQLGAEERQKFVGSRLCAELNVVDDNA